VKNSLDSFPNKERKKELILGGLGMARRGGKSTETLWLGRRIVGVRRQGEKIRATGKQRNIRSLLFREVYSREKTKGLTKGKRVCKNE